MSPPTGLPSFPSMDAVQRWAMETIAREGSPSSPRGQETSEILAAGFTLADPRRRCVTNQERRWSLPLAIGEFAWHASGSDDLSFIASYAPRWRDFSEDGRTISGSCYGRRVFGAPDGSSSQWDLLRAILRRDPSSRRAVLNFQQDPAEALRPDSPDTACATVLQFLVRDGRVHAIAYMRSNDVVWGLPYDVFLFTMLQEMLACDLGLDLGSYSHVAGSLHVYARHRHLVERVLASADPEPFQMPPMDGTGGLPDFLARERAVRSETTSALPRGRHGFWSDLADVLRLWTSYRIDPSATLLPHDSPYGPVLSPLLPNAGSMG